MDEATSGGKATGGTYEDGVFRMGGVRIIDRTGARHLPVGDDGFARAASDSVVVDKTLLARDVIKGGAVTLFCRPRRFGKTLNMTMLRSFFEASQEATDVVGVAEAGAGKRRAGPFEGTAIMEVDGGAWVKHRGRYPVIYISFNDAKKLSWEHEYGVIADIVATEYLRHPELADSSRLGEDDRAYFSRIAGKRADYAEVARSLSRLASMLRRHTGQRVVILIDEYDAPVMTGYSNGYYAEVVDFLKGWLTGALKDGGEALFRAALTGVQRISKESIFSDLNNLSVSTALDTLSDERFGFTQAEVEALATYLGADTNIGEIRAWYDGYRFGRVDVYNPWSVLKYFSLGCQTGIYWANTSGSGLIGNLVAKSDERQLAQIYGLTEPGGEVSAPLDLGVVFPELGVHGEALWSFLYLAGYLTTEDTGNPTDDLAMRRLRVPNHEVSLLFRREIVQRFSRETGGVGLLRELQAAVVGGDGAALTSLLRRALVDAASYHDLIGENSYHMLMLGLLFDVDGYPPPTSNREAGDGRFDIRLEPRDAKGARPVVTFEFKVLDREDAPASRADREALDAALHARAGAALAQIAERGYDEADAGHAAGRLRYGIAFAGKRVAVAVGQA